MKFFTLQLWIDLQDWRKRDEGSAKWDEAFKEYFAQLDKLRSCLTEEAFFFFADADVHDGELMELTIVDGSRPAPLSEQPRRWDTPTNKPVRLDLQVLDAWDRFLWQLSYRGVQRVLVDFPTGRPFRHPEGSGFGDWGYHELTAVDDRLLRHEVLFATGSTLLFEFEKVEVAVREAREQRGDLPFFRALTDWEKDLVRHMLHIDFPGRDELLRQVESIRGSSDTGNWENGSLRFRCESSILAPIAKGTFGTDGQGSDADGSMIQYFLHFDGGRLRGLDVRKSDQSRVLQHPDLSNIKVKVHR